MARPNYGARIRNIQRGRKKGTYDSCLLDAVATPGFAPVCLRDRRDLGECWSQVSAETARKVRVAMQAAFDALLTASERIPRTTLVIVSKSMRWQAVKEHTSTLRFRHATHFTNRRGVSSSTLALMGYAGRR